MSTSSLPGVLLAQAGHAKAEGWLRKGTVPCYLVPLGGWSAIVPAGPSAAAAPYDDGVSMLAARPVAGALRPALGFYRVGDRAVLVAHPRGQRGASRWLAWAPGRGSLVLPGHEPAHPRDLLTISGLAETERDGLLDVLRRKEGGPDAFLRHLMSALGLPGAELLDGTGVPLREDAVLVTPEAKRVRQFDRDVSEEREVHEQLGEPW